MASSSFGCWPSPLAPATMAASSRRISAPWFAPGPDMRVVWAESRPEQGRTTLMVRDGDGDAVELLAAPWDVGSRVHEYGGRSHVAWGDTVVFVHRVDHSVWRKDGDGEPVCLLAGGVARIAEPIVDARRGRLVAVAELVREVGEPKAALVAIPLAGGSALTILREGADFYAAPTIDEAGDRLAWIEWNHPHMPWDASAVFAARLDDAGAIVDARHVAGDRDASAQQPVGGPDGALYFLWEPDGAWTLHRMRDGQVRRVAPPDAELGGPLWNLGMRTWGFVGDREALAVRLRSGVAELVRIDVDSGEVASVATPSPSIGHLAVTRGAAAVLEGWDGRGVALSIVDRDGTPGFVRGTGLFDALEPASWSTPRAVTFATSDGDVAHAWYYPPHLPGHTGEPGTLPPLVVVAHGGPTGLALASANLPVQFWTTRGYAVIDVNYRGSTGFGRAYRERLRGKWGIYDVDDCVAAAKWAIAEGLVDPARTIIRGTSAGGFTVLAALAFHDVFRTGASHYGVSDVASLVAHTHKFEAHYDAFLFGEDAGEAVWRERSPLHAASRISVPVVFFQGADDPVVPQAQTGAMAAALRKEGIEVEVHTYAGEGHGFRKPENIAHAWATEAAIYCRVLALGGASARPR